MLLNISKLNHKDESEAYINTDFYTIMKMPI